jgi:DNA-binding winged helix-turn-helix (wHTH) protein/tetratricopeptide (TPR) repeat protein
MRYRFGEFMLDPTALLLSRDGSVLETPRRVFLCLSYLIAQRERAICREELIRHVWGRDNVSDHQLAQVILAARQLVGDDGTAQRLIRTVQSFGYHWVGAVLEVAAAGTAALPEDETIAVPMLTPVDVSVVESAPQPPSEVPIANAAAASELVVVPSTRQRPAGKQHRAGWLALTLIAVAVIGWQLQPVAPLVPIAPVISKNAAESRRSGGTADESQVVRSALDRHEPLTRLREALRRGRFEEVREGLVRLPVQLADSAEGRMLEIQLDIDRGRWQFAAEKIIRQRARALAAADTVWQAKLLLLQSRLNYRRGRLVADALAPAEAAIGLLESVPSKVSPLLLAEALSDRGRALFESEQPDDAIQDLIRARDLYLSVAQPSLATDVSTNLARVWMRNGRLLEALDQLNNSVGVYVKFQEPTEEIVSHNTALRIQVELLRWRGALASSDRSMQLLQAAPDFERRYRALQLRGLALTGLGRLREAASMLDEAQAARPNAELIIPTNYYLASGQNARALSMAAAAFAVTGNNDINDVLFDNRDGTLLLWMIAAQQLAREGKAMPEPSAAQLSVLRKPESNLADIACGRWLWASGKATAAKVKLRKAVREARQRNLLYRQLLASEPLVELLLEQGETAAAAEVLTELRAQDTDRLDQDYQGNVLELRVALALGQRSAIVAAYQRTAALAGERKVPADVLLAYTRKMSAADGQMSVSRTGSQIQPK